MGPLGVIEPPGDTGGGSPTATPALINIRSRSAINRVYTLILRPFPPAWCPRLGAPAARRHVSLRANAPPDAEESTWRLTWVQAPVLLRRLRALTEKTRPQEGGRSGPPPARCRRAAGRGQGAGTARLFQPFLNLGESGAGTLLIELPAGRATHADRPDRGAASHDRHPPTAYVTLGRGVCGTVVAGFLLMRSATAFVLSSFRASVSDAAE